MTDLERASRASMTSRRDVLGLGVAVASLALADEGWAAIDGSPGRGLQSLGYVVVPGKDLDAWDLWGPKVFGLQLADRSATTRVFRMDDHQHRFAVDRSAQIPTFGWEVADARALDAMAARLDTAGVEVARGSRALASQRGVRDLVTLQDPAGNRIEIFHGAALANTPFQPARTMAGFRTGKLGMGHAAIMVQQEIFEQTTRFYRGLLGFRLSDYGTNKGVRVIEFMHINPREHSLVVSTGSGNNNTNHLHHVMMEMVFMDDVGHAYDIVLKDYQKSLALTLGRHPNDLMTSFYVRSPSDFWLECGWGGLLVDPERWQAGDLTGVPSIWGHQFMEDGQPAPADFSPPPTFRALGAPLQVYGENYGTNRRPTDLAQVLKTEPMH